VKKQEDPEVGYVRDGDINYLVLNATSGDYTMNDKSMDKLEKVID
jgi:hypothetical protein